MKKLVSVLLAVMMLVSLLAACGGKEDPQPQTTDENVIILGCIGPLSGGYSNYGISTRNGAEMAVAEINANGGINGMQIVLKFEDSEGDPDSAVAAYGKLMDEGMNVSMGTVFSGEMASVSAAAVPDDILVMSPTATADTAIESNEKAFRLCFYDSYQGEAAAQYIYDNELATEVGVFYQSDLNYSVGLYDAFVAKCAELGITIVETQTFTAASATDFSAQVNALADTGVKLVFMPIYAEEASTFLTQAQGKFAEDVYFFGADGLDGILGKVAQDPTLANNVLMLTPFAADNQDPVVKTFVEGYQKLYNETPDQFAADGYDVVYAIKQAVEEAGCTTAEECTATVLVPAVLNMEFTGVTGTATWDEDGNTVKAALAVLYYDGVGTLFGE